MKSAADTYYSKRCTGINPDTIKIWEREIQDAELHRLDDRKVMDILKARPVDIESAAISFTSAVSEPVGIVREVEDWIQMGLDIEEQQ